MKFSSPIYIKRKDIKFHKILRSSFKNARAERFFTASNPCHEDSVKQKDACASILFYGKTGIRTLEAVLALTRFPVVRLRPTQPSFHSRLPMLLFICPCSIPHFFGKIKSFFKKIQNFKKIYFWYCIFRILW